MRNMARGGGEDNPAKRVERLLPTLPAYAAAILNTVTLADARDGRTA